MEGCNFRNILPINVPKCSGGNLIRNSQSNQTSITYNLVFSLPLRILLKPRTFSIKKDNRSENFIGSKVSRRTQKVEIHLASEGSGLAFFSTDLGHFFGSNVGSEFGVMLRGKGPHKPEFAQNIVRIHSLMIYNNLTEYNIVGDTKTPLLRCFFLFRSSSLDTL